MELTVKLEGPILAKLKKADTVVVNFFQDAMREASTIVLERSIREAPASTGNLRKGIRREFSGNGLEAQIYPSVQYGEALHGPFTAGGRTHSAPFTIPVREAQPGGTLYRWAKKKGLNPYAVRASIKKKGVRYNPYLKRAAESTETPVRTVFEGAIKKVSEYFGD